MAENSPDWLKNAYIYEVFPRNHSKEGTLQEISEDLSRIKSMNIDILWLMPVNPIGKEGRKGSYGSPYAIKDYRALNSNLGNREDLRKLIARAHSLDMKVMMDIVFNHTARDSKLIEKYTEWFLRDRQGNITRKCEDWEDVVDLDFSNRDLWDYLIDVLREWAIMGIDGFRCDVAPLIPVEFWEQARKSVNKVKEVVWLAESVEKSFLKYLREQGYTIHSDPVLHRVFDLTYDYDGFEYLKEYFSGREGLKPYLNHLHIQDTLYPEHAIKMRFLENHDNPRSAEVISDKDQLKNWIMFIYLLPGAGLIYAGQEYGLQKGPNLFEKDSINWQDGDRELFEYYKLVLKLAKGIKGKCENFSVEQIVRGVVKITWKGKSEKYIAILNLDNRYGEISVDFEVSGENLITSTPVNISKKLKLRNEPILLKTDNVY